jgi:hypothetical protein
MKIIMLTGESNKGKTAVLTFVHEILATDGAKPTCFKRAWDKYERDFSDVLEYREKKIKIFTTGDELKKIKEVLNYTECDFLICACNNKFLEPLENVIKVKKIRKIKKTVAKTLASRLAANWYDANIIIGYLEKYIGRIL